MPRTHKQSSQTRTHRGNRWAGICQRVGRALWAGLLFSPTWLSVAHALPTVQVLAGTELQVALSSDRGLGVREQGRRARVTLLTDAGTRLSNHPVAVELHLGERVLERTLTTDQQGVTELNVPPDTVSIAARYAGQGGYAPSTALPLRLETTSPSQAAHSHEPLAPGLWPWLVSLVILGGLAAFRARTAKTRETAPHARRVGVSPSAPPIPGQAAPPSRESYAMVLDADLGLPIAGARMVSPDGSPSPQYSSDQRGCLRLPRSHSDSAYLVKAEGYETRTVFAGQLAPVTGDQVVLRLRSLRSALWERLQRSADVAQPSDATGAPRSPAQWARHHGPTAGPVLSAIERALFAAAPLTSPQVDELEAALKRALASGDGPNGPARAGDDREFS